MSTPFVDVHCHLDFDNFDENRNQLTAELSEKNIICLSNTTNFENYIYTKKLYASSPHIYVTPGLYPQESEKMPQKEFEEYVTYLKTNQKKFIAIGEVGLDAHRTKDTSLLSVQKKRFKKFIELAIEIDKPLIIHTRNQETEVLKILKSYIEKHNFRKFVLHCFMGGKDLINIIKDLNIFVSIPLTIYTHKCFRKLVEIIPLKNILVETDSPYLNLQPKTNTPLNVPKIYKKIADIKGISENELKEQIYNNFQRLFSDTAQNPSTHI